MDALADRNWRLIREDVREGPMHMALEEVATRTAVEDDLRTVRVFTWAPSTLSMGYGQAADSVDWAYCEDRGIDVTRRPTGGGGIYHDRHADVSYTIVAPADELPGNLMESYELLCEPILAGLRAMGVEAAFAEHEYPAIHQPACYLREIHPAHDIVAGGRKLSGNAQYRQRDAVIQHGSISVDLAPSEHLGVFADHGVDAETFRDRVTSVRAEAGIEREQAVETLEQALGEWCDADPEAWTDAELSAAAELAARKYSNEAWIHEREAPVEA